jgi:hypothetical protein
VFLFAFPLCLSHGNTKENKWSEWCRPEFKDLQDFERELPRIACGKIWHSPVPLFDFNEGLTYGKTMHKIGNMLN